jgi:hypothetical protein
MVSGRNADIFNVKAGVMYTIYCAPCNELKCILGRLVVRVGEWVD